MKKEAVLKYFNNCVTDVANACRVSCASVSQWGEIIPEVNALKLERATKGKLKYESKMYEKHQQSIAS